LRVFVTRDEQDERFHSVSRKGNRQEREEEVVCSGKIEEEIKARASVS